MNTEQFIVSSFSRGDEKDPKDGTKQLQIHHRAEDGRHQFVHCYIGLHYFKISRERNKTTSNEET